MHPKTGPLGAENITDESKALLYKRVLNCIESDNLYQISLDSTGQKIIFSNLKNKLKKGSENNSNY